MVSSNVPILTNPNHDILGVRFGCKHSLFGIQATVLLPTVGVRCVRFLGLLKFCLMPRNHPTIWRYSPERLLAIEDYLLPLTSPCMLTTWLPRLELRYIIYRLLYWMLDKVHSNTVCMVGWLSLPSERLPRAADAPHPYEFEVLRCWISIHKMFPPDQARMWNAIPYALFELPRWMDLRQVLLLVSSMSLFSYFQKCKQMLVLLIWQFSCRKSLVFF